MEELIRQFIDICSGIGWVFNKMEWPTIIGLIIMLFLIWGTLNFISQWQIYSKAGRSGWLIMVPIYNALIFADICKVPRTIFILSFMIGFVCGLINNDIALIVNYVCSLSLSAYWSYSLAKVYGRDLWFTMGLIFMPLVFYPILGLGNYEYEG